MKVELTKSQCNNVAEFIGTNILNILDVIRKDTNIEDLGYVVDLLTAKAALEKAVKEYEGN